MSVDSGFAVVCRKHVPATDAFWFPENDPPLTAGYTQDEAFEIANHWVKEASQRSAYVYRKTAGGLTLVKRFSSISGVHHEQ